jgi:hypothetical protein
MFYSPHYVYLFNDSGWFYRVVGHSGIPWVGAWDGKLTRVLDDWSRCWDSIFWVDFLWRSLQHEVDMLKFVLFPIPECSPSIQASMQIRK